MKIGQLVQKLKGGGGSYAQDNMVIS